MRMPILKHTRLSTGQAGDRPGLHSACCLSWFQVPLRAMLWPISPKSVGRGGHSKPRYLPSHRFLDSRKANSASVTYVSDEDAITNLRG